MFKYLKKVSFCNVYVRYVPLFRPSISDTVRTCQTVIKENSHLSVFHEHFVSLSELNSNHIRY